ncbi:MAG: CHASE2 domain-containing protein [Myxococcales bacterium]|nr:CHASE2 domain-containing protein [Myxococcales bacterium]
MVGVSLVGTAIAVGGWELDLLGMRGAELGAYDDGLNAFTNKSWFPWGQAGRSKDIVILAIDDKTFEQVSLNESYKLNYGSWPYSRNVWAHAFTHLVDEGAKMVVFDAVIDEPHTDPSGDLAMAQVIGEKKVPFYLGFSWRPKARSLPKVEPKNRLPEPPVLGAPPGPKAAEPAKKENGKGQSERGETKAAKAAPKPAEEEFPSEEFPSAEAPATEEKPKEADDKLLQVAQALSFPVLPQGGLSLTQIEPTELVDDEGKPTGKQEPQHPIPPLEPLLGVTPGFGAVTLEDDDDGKMRRTRFAYTDGNNTYATMALSVVADFVKAERVVIEPGKLTIGSHLVPINRDGSAEINYGGKLDARFKTVSLINVLDDFANKQSGQPRKEAMKDVFKDKIVLIAGFAVGTADVKPTPFSNNSPGVVKHAAEIDNLLHGAFITEAPYWMSVLLAFLTAFFSVMLITVVRSTLLEIGWPLLLFFGFFVVTGSFLVITKTHVLSAMPAMAGELASVAAVAFNHLFARKDREHLREMFQAYMEKDLVEQMVEQRELPRLDGENFEVTAFFSDIKGFSTISEQLKADPRQLMKLLNRYLSRVTPVLKSHAGCIDKYIGDAVVCLFGAPIRNQTHAVDACRSALAVQRELAKLREELKAEGLPELYTRIGLNTDVMLVGNIGSKDLLDYTALGDGMNLASRLEGANKGYGTLIMIGPRTFELAKDAIEARELDWVRVAGKSEAVAVYEVLSLKGQLPEAKHQLRELYSQALALYRKARFREALGVLAEAHKLDPKDGPTLALGTRCKNYLQNPPPPPFDGVISLDK